MYTNLNDQRACTIKQMSYTVFTKIPVEAQHTTKNAHKPEMIRYTYNYHY